MPIEQLAEHARSILEFPKSMSLWLEGEAQNLDDSALHVFHDWHGTPEIRCVSGSPLVTAAHQNTAAVLQIISDASNEELLILVGKLRWIDTERCYCCGETRERLVLIADAITLERDKQKIPISKAAFRDPALQLNWGFLERNRRHINDAHEEELRISISRIFGVEYEGIITAHMVNLAVGSVDLGWITINGVHREKVHFNRVARTAEELTEQLRWSLQVLIY